MHILLCTSTQTVKEDKSYKKPHHKSIFVDTYLTPTSAQWIGAYWIGYFVFGAFLFIMLPILLMFPKRLPIQGTPQSPFFLHGLTALNQTRNLPVLLLLIPVRIGSRSWILAGYY
mgnify:CR=1 FL=1